MILNLICFAHSVYREHPADKSYGANPQVQRERQVGQEKWTDCEIENRLNT